MNAAVPFGMESADFRALMATVAIAFAAALVLVVLLIVVRDILVARYAALGRQEKPERPSRGTHLPPVPGSPLPRLYEHEIPVSPSQHPQLQKRPRPPKADPTAWSKPTMVRSGKADRLRTPSPASDRRGTPDRVSGSADRDADRTRLDITPTEENP